VFAKGSVLGGAILGTLIGIWQAGLLIFLSAATGHRKRANLPIDN
jgi:hypothetical protein